MSPDDVRDVVLEYIKQEYVDEDDDDTEVTYDTKLISSGIVDSFSLVSMKVFLEKKYGITIPDAEANTETFNTVSGIAEVVKKHQAG